MLIIAIVALLVVGPERMPEAVRGAAMTIGRLKRMFNSTKEEFEKQIGADDIRLDLHNEQIMDNLKKMKDDMSEIDSELTKLTEDDEDRKFMEEDNYQDPPEFRGEDLHSKDAMREEPFAFNDPLAAEEPSTTKKPLTKKKPSATKKPSTRKKPSTAKKPSTNSEPIAQKTSAKDSPSEENTILNKNKSPV